MPPSSPLHPCVACRRRKVKCDRNQPCSRCLITGDDCYQPEVQRAPRRSQKPRDTVLRDRVRQLESSLKEIKPLVLEEKVKESHKGLGPELKVEHFSTGHLINGEERTRYISASSWVSLADKLSAVYRRLRFLQELRGKQIFDLRTLLDDEFSDEEEHNINATIPGDIISQNVPHQPSVISAPLLIHNFRFLWATYLANVDPVFKVLHVPTSEKLLESACAFPETISPSIRCLLAVVQFAAVTSMTDAQCQSAISSSRESVLTMLRTQIKEALDAANLVTSHSLMTLQAFVIFLVSSSLAKHFIVILSVSGV